jgi:hypothetical protein
MHPTSRFKLDKKNDIVPLSWISFFYLDRNTRFSKFHFGLEGKILKLYIFFAEDI